MVKLLDNKIEELFQSIKQSEEYKSYKNITKILDNNKEMRIFTHNNMYFREDEEN